MPPTELWLTLAFDALIVTYGITALGMDTGTMESPGAGTVPLVLAVLGLVLGASWILMLRGKRVTRREQASPETLPDHRRVATIIVICCVYIVLLPRLGFLTTSALTSVALLKTMGIPLKKAIAFSFSLCGLLWLVLDYWLRVPFPAGPMGV